MPKITWNKEEGSSSVKKGAEKGGSILLTPFLLMLLLGAIHSAYHNIPALGFKIVWFVSMGFLLIGEYFKD